MSHTALMTLVSKSVTVTCALLTPFELVVLTICVFLPKLCAYGDSTQKGWVKSEHVTVTDLLHSAPSAQYASYALFTLTRIYVTAGDLK
jgi:hypothetical protein